MTDPAHIAELDQAVALLRGKVDQLVRSAGLTAAVHGPEQTVRAVFQALAPANHEKVAAIAAVAVVRLAEQARQQTTEDRP